MSDSPTSPSPRSWWSRGWSVLQVLQVRLRFAFILLLVFLVLGYWQTITHYWQHWIGRIGLAPAEQSVSSSIEFFCPMCPGVHSAWPAQCPVGALADIVQPPRPGATDQDKFAAHHG